jgi:hypothetical protein
LIPAGTGFKGSKKHTMITDLQNELDAQEIATAPAATTTEQ